MIIQSAQTMSFSGDSFSEDTIQLKSSSLYTGIRIAVHSTSGDNTLSLIDKIVIDVPDYMNNAKRVELSGESVKLLPLICQLGAAGQADAASATTTNAMTGADEVAGFALYDIGINKMSTDRDTLITIKAKGGSDPAHKTTISFGFVDTPFRSVFFDVTNVAEDSTVNQTWFTPSGTLQGVIVATHNGGALDARNNTDINEISLDGERDTTFSDPQILAGGLDELVDGGDQAHYYSKNVYALARNFVTKAGVARYVATDRAASTALFVIGVMSDA